MPVAQLEAVVAKTSLEQIWEKVDKPHICTEFNLRYTKYLNKVNHFLENGSKWVTPHGFFSQLREMRSLQTYNQFEEWMLTEKPRLVELHTFHETWLSDKKPHHVRLAQWLPRFLKYSNFKNVRPMVGILYKKPFFNDNQYQQIIFFLG